MRTFTCVLGVLGAAQLACASGFSEVEPNSARTTAQNIGPMASGDQILGASAGSTVTTSTSSALFSGSSDWFRVQTAPAPLAIYRHTLRMESRDNNTTVVARHNPSIQGLNSSGTDVTIQNSHIPDTSEPFSVNGWYGFGRSERVLYRVTGSSLTTTYTSTLESTLVVPSDLGAIGEGAVTLSALATEIVGGSNLSAIALYDSNLNRIGYADNVGIAPTPASITANLTQGVYFFAAGLTVIDSATTNQRLDFADGVATSSVGSGVNLSVSIGLSGGPLLASAGTVGATELYWGRFEVVPAPGAGAASLFGMLLLSRRRRA